MANGREGVRRRFGDKERQENRDDERCRETKRLKDLGRNNQKGSQDWERRSPERERGGGQVESVQQRIRKGERRGRAGRVVQEGAQSGAPLETPSSGLDLATSPGSGRVCSVFWGAIPVGNRSTPNWEGKMLGLRSELKVRDVSGA